jgi:hypothetical protein
MEQRWDDTDREYPMWDDTDREYPMTTKRNLSQCHFVYHKSHMDCSGSKPGPKRCENGDNCLSYGTAPRPTITGLCACVAVQRTTENHSTTIRRTIMITIMATMTIRMQSFQKTNTWSVISCVLRYSAGTDEQNKDRILVTRQPVPNYQCIRTEELSERGTARPQTLPHVITWSQKEPRDCLECKNRMMEVERVWHTEVIPVTVGVSLRVWKWQNIWSTFLLQSKPI